MAKKVATTTNRKTKDKSKLIPALSVLFVLLVVYFSYYAYQLVFPDNVYTNDQETFVYIPTGATYEQAMDAVEASGVIIVPLSLRFMAKLMDYDKLVKPGRYQLEDGMGNRQLIGKLRLGEQTPVKLTFAN